VCNLYRITKGAADIAGLFRASYEPAANLPAEAYPGYPGLVIADGQARAMTWGFPLILKGKQGQPLKPKPVNNTRADKLTTGFWRPSFERRRCLIPVSAFAEAEGDRVRMTQTWFTLPDQPVFSVAGIWRESVEWGPVYSMVMTEACVYVGPVHDRMPVILRPSDAEMWLTANSDDALGLCQPYDGVMLMARTTDPWVASRSGPSPQTAVLV
jgi:putative SOS response-associated peptidase YedK